MLCPTVCSSIIIAAMRNNSLLLMVIRFYTAKYRKKLGVNIGRGWKFRPVGGIALFPSKID